MQEKQMAENRKFNRVMLLSFSSFLLLIISVLVFFTYWPDSKYAFRKITLYGKIVPDSLICMDGDYLLYDAGTEVISEDKSYFFCSEECSGHFTKHFKEVALSVDAFSGDTIWKADALIGLKKRGSPEVIYFKDRSNFEKYYHQNDKKKQSFKQIKITKDDK